MHRNNCLWRKWTQIHDALKTEDKQHGSSCDRGQLPLQTLPFSFMKMDGQWWSSETGFYTYFLCAWVSCSQWACSPLLCGGPVEGTWRKREVFRKYLSTRKAFHLALARSSMQWSMSFLLKNVLPGPELFNGSWTVDFLHLEHREVSITGYFVATSSEALWVLHSCYCWIQTAYEEKILFPFLIMFSTNVMDCIGRWLLASGLQTSVWPANLHRLSRYFLIGGKW